MSSPVPPDLGAIYEAFHPRIRRYLARLIGVDEAEDAAQEVFVKAGRGLPGFRNESELSTWIYRIATNTAADRVRSAGHQAALRSAPIEASDTIPDRACSAERQSIRKEMSGCVQDLLGQLTEDDRTILALSEASDLKDREIADVLGITHQAAKIRLHRARVRLRKRLERRCSFYRDPENTLVCDIKRAPVGAA